MIIKRMTFRWVCTECGFTNYTKFMALSNMSIIASCRNKFCSNEVSYPRDRAIQEYKERNGV